jgi:uncharacterized protein YecE (DUF72 family)
VSELRIGCSGWNYEHWRRGVFYPPRLPASSWLRFYSQHFDTVEVNATFYRLPRPSAVANWVALTPPNFVFAIKMSRYVTHVKRLTGVKESLERLYGTIAPLVGTPKLGPVLWQFPETFHRNDERLLDALDELPEGRHAFEFRHASWFAPEVLAFLRARNAALVIGDHPDRPFQTLEPIADWTFMRFHYGRRGHGGNYSERELDEWAARIDGWQRRGIDVYAYFNNDWEGFAPRNASRLRDLLEERASGRTN